MIVVLIVVAAAPSDKKLAVAVARVLGTVAVITIKAISACLCTVHGLSRLACGRDPCLRFRAQVFLL